MPRHRVDIMHVGVSETSLSGRAVRRAGLASVDYRLLRAHDRNL